MCWLVDAVSPKSLFDEKIKIFKRTMPSGQAEVSLSSIF